MIYGSLFKKNGDGKLDTFNKDLCDLRHKQLDERHTEMREAITEIKTNMTKGFETVFIKLDNMSKDK